MGVPPTRFYAFDAQITAIKMAASGLPRNHILHTIMKSQSLRAWAATAWIVSFANLVYADGILLSKKYPDQPTEFWSPLEYTAIKPYAAAYQVTLKSTGQNIPVPRSDVGTVIEFLSLSNANLVTEEDAAGMRTALEALQKQASTYKTAAAILNREAKSLQLALQNFSSGNVLVAGKWISKSAYDALAAQAAQAARSGSIPELVVGDRSFRNVQVTSVRGDRISIMHDGGISPLDIQSIPPKALERLKATFPARFTEPDKSGVPLEALPAAATNLNHVTSTLPNAENQPAEFPYSISKLKAILVSEGYNEGSVMYRSNSEFKPRSVLRNDEIDLEVAIFGNENIAAVTVGVQLGRRGAEAAARALAHARDICNALAPDSGQWFMDRIREATKGDNLSSNVVRDFGQARVSIETAAASDSTKLSGITVRVRHVGTLARTPLTAEKQNSDKSEPGFPANQPTNEFAKVFAARDEDSRQAILKRLCGLSSLRESDRVPEKHCGPLFALSAILDGQVKVSKAEDGFYFGRVYPDRIEYGEAEEVTPLSLKVAHVYIGGKRGKSGKESEVILVIAGPNIFQFGPSDSSDYPDARSLWLYMNKTQEADLYLVR